jgi:hypothetical protein
MLFSHCKAEPFITCSWRENIGYSDEWGDTNRYGIMCKGPSDNRTDWCGEGRTPIKGSKDKAFEARPSMNFLQPKQHLCRF